jgi:hypothetical protein
MVREEVEEALKLRPLVYVQRVDGRIIFTQTDGDRGISEDDLTRNAQLYHDHFWAKYREMHKHDNEQ